MVSKKKNGGVFKRNLIISEPEDVAISRHNLVLASFHFLVIYTLFFLNPIYNVFSNKSGILK